MPTSRGNTMAQTSSAISGTDEYRRDRERILPRKGEDRLQPSFAVRDGACAEGGSPRT
jgi:hypothetical protein